MREIERSCLGILTIIEASYMSEIRYTPLLYVSNMPTSCILQMLSPHATHMPSFFDPQMSGSSSSYMPQMTTSGPSWHHDSSSEWFDLVVTGPSLDPYEGVEGVTQLIDAPTASVILDMHAQETSTDIGEGPSQVIQEQERPLRIFVRRSKRLRAPRCPYGF